MSIRPDEDDTDSDPPASARPPSAAALIALDRLLGHLPSQERMIQAWREVMGAAGNLDFHAVLDFALEHELVRDCDPGNPKAMPVSWINPVDGSDMIWVPAGPFVYGRSDKAATCDGFSLGRWPVTNAQFRRFLDQTGYEPHEAPPDQIAFLAHWRGGAIPAGKERHPVVNVSLLDALAYARWAGLTLPTEWLWEKAARGPEGRTHPWGEAPPGVGTKKLAHVGEPTTVEVGMYCWVRSPYGCEELVGNVSEWTLPVAATEPPGWFPPPWPTIATISETGRPLHGIVRGACFLRTGLATTRSSHRRQLSVTRRNFWTGFRVAALLPCRPGEG